MLRPQEPRPAFSRRRVSRRHWLGQLIRGGLGGFAGGALLHNQAHAAAAPTEYQVKAALLLKFPKFTSWPPGTFADTRTPLIVGVLGHDPFGSALDEAVGEELSSVQPVLVKRLSANDNPAACHALFVSRSERGNLTSVLETLKKKPVLTVSDFEGFCQLGGMVSLVISARGTVNPEVNPDAALSAGMQISSKLLRLPTVKLVKTET